MKMFWYKKMREIKQNRDIHVEEGLLLGTCNLKWASLSRLFCEVPVSVLFSSAKRIVIATFTRGQLQIPPIILILSMGITSI